MLARQVNLT
jgi:hypothetical protein